MAEKAWYLAHTVEFFLDGALRFLINSCILDIDAVIFGTENRPKRPGNTKIFASGGLGNYLAQPGSVGTDIRTVELPVVSQEKSALPNDCDLIIILHAAA